MRGVGGSAHPFQALGRKDLKKKNFTSILTFYEKFFRFIPFLDKMKKYFIFPSARFVFVVFSSNLV